MQNALGDRRFIEQTEKAFHFPGVFSMSDLVNDPQAHLKFDAFGKLRFADGRIASHEVTYKLWQTWMDQPGVKRNIGRYVSKYGATLPEEYVAELMNTYLLAPVGTLNTEVEATANLLATILKEFK